MEIEIPHNGLYKHEDNILVGIMYSLDTGEEAAAIDQVGTGVSDARFKSGIAALKLIRTPEAYATSTNFHEEKVQDSPVEGNIGKPGETKMPLIIRIPLKKESSPDQVCLA